MSDPPPTEPKSDKAPDPKDIKGKGLDKFIDKYGKLPHAGTDTEPGIIVSADPVPTEDDKDYKEELEKLQKKQYNTERKIALQALEAVNPEVAEKYKGKKLSDIETALEVAKVVIPKFPVNREAAPEPSTPKQGYKDPRDGKWK